MTLEYDGRNHIFYAILTSSLCFFLNGSANALKRHVWNQCYIAIIMPPLTPCNVCTEMRYVLGLADRVSYCYLQVPCSPVHFIFVFKLLGGALERLWQNAAFHFRLRCRGHGTLIWNKIIPMSDRHIDIISIANCYQPISISMDEGREKGMP